MKKAHVNVPFSSCSHVGGKGKRVRLVLVLVIDGGKREKFGNMGSTFE
jgi:hypothetical protein